MGYYCQQDMPLMRQLFSDSGTVIRAQAPTCRYVGCGEAGSERGHLGGIMCPPHARLG